MPASQQRISFIERIRRTAIAAYNYVTAGVWRDTRDSVWVRIVKTLNLSVRAFFDSELQFRSMALTYSTVLAIVPGFALMFAIGRGFGFQNLLQESLFQYFPAQRHALQTAITFVDSYLKQASQGVFVGVGIIVLLWTMISLLSGIEDTFNRIWDIKHDRTIYRKITDYTAICLIIPVLMICSSGITLIMATMGSTLTNTVPWLTPLVNTTLDIMPFVLVWLAFTLSFLLIPNTKVGFSYSAAAGLICGVAFEVVQYLLMTGQIYVSKYNAIYGSFAFLPLLLIWLQLSWLILLFGCVLTYSAQNVFGFNFLGDVGQVSQNYMKSLTATIFAIIVSRQRNDERPLTPTQISSSFDLPVRLVNRIVGKLHRSGLVYLVMLGKDLTGVAPAIETDTFTLEELFRRVDACGKSDFIPHYAQLYAQLIGRTRPVIESAYSAGENVLIRDLPLPEPPFPQFLNRE